MTCHNLWYLLLSCDAGVPLLVVRIETFLCFDGSFQRIYAWSWLDFEVVHCALTFVPQFGCNNYVMALRTVWIICQIRCFVRLKSVDKWSQSPYATRDSLLRQLWLWSNVLDEWMAASLPVAIVRISANCLHNLIKTMCCFGLTTIWYWDWDWVSCLTALTTVWLFHINLVFNGREIEFTIDQIEFYIEKDQN